MENNNKNDDYGVYIELKTPDDFLKIKESLTRIGVASKKTKTLYQSCHILHTKGLYRVMHFKELFRLDGKTSLIEDDDLLRRNLIATLLEEWGLCKIIDPESVKSKGKINSIKILPYSEKNEWKLEQKYSLGGSK